MAHVPPRPESYGILNVESPENKPNVVELHNWRSDWVFSSPAVADGIVFVGSNDTKVYALNASTGEYIWSYTTPGWVLSSPGVADGKVYVGSWDLTAWRAPFYCLDASTGAFIWSYRTNDPTIDSSPAIVDSIVYLSSDDSNVYAFGVHDVAITNVTSSKTVVGQGFSASINVTVANQGGYTETFNVTLYANTTIIDTLTNITLTSGNSTTLTFTWNTTGFVKGNCTIEAYASPVQNETDITDNRRTDGWVVVTWLGDLTDKDHLTPPDGVPDGKVDENDLWYFCGAFIDYYKIPRLDPNCDFDNNNKIDEDDLWKMCEAFIDYWKQH